MNNALNLSDNTEFESILKNEQTEVKGDIKTQLASTGLFPTFGKVNTIYTTNILVNQIIIAFLVPLKLVFMESGEEWGYVYYDIYLDLLFFIDLIVKFNTPVYQEGRLITNRKTIVMAYLKGWFILDLLSCIPFAYIRKNSESWPRGQNE